MCENMVCERDVKGCEVCTCSKDNTKDNDLLKPFPRALHVTHECDLKRGHLLLEG